MKKLLMIALLIMSNDLISADQYKVKIADPIPEAWRWTHFSELEGKGVRCMTQDQNGKLWFGVDEGLMNYDGYRWNLIAKPSMPQPLTINKIVSSQNNKIYAGTDNGIYAISDSAWVDMFPQSSSLGITIDITDIIVLPDSSLMAGFQGLAEEKLVAGMLRIKNQNVTIYCSKSTKENLSSKYVHDVDFEIVEEELTIGVNSVFSVVDLYFGQNQKLYAAISNSRDLGKILTYDFISETDHLELDKIHSKKYSLKIRGSIEITQTQDGKIWVVSGAYDLGLYTYENKKWEEIRLSEEFGGVNSQYSILAASDGNVWIEGHGRILLLRDNEWTVYQYPEIPISTASRLSFFESFDQNIWVLGKLTEVFKFENTSRVWITYEDLNFQFETASGAKWYLSKDGKAVVNQNDQWISYDVLDGLMTTPVRLNKTSYGEIWAQGSHNQVAATAYFDGKNWNKALYPKVSWGIDFRAFFESKDGSLWFGTSIDLQSEKGHQGGIIRYSNPRYYKDQWIHYSLGEGVNIESCYGIGESNDGIIWFGGRPLHTFDGASWNTFDESKALREYVDDIQNDSNGNLWLASRYYGVFRYDGVKWDHFTVEHGLASNNVINIYAEDENNIWVLTYEGACHYDGHRWTSNLLPEKLIKDPEGGRILKSKSGHLWYNHAANDWKRRSLTYPISGPDVYRDFRASRYIPDKSPPETQITSYSKNVDENGVNVIFWRGNDFFEVTSSSELEYSWSLNNGEWSEFSTENYQRFNNLAAGSNVLKVRARDHEFNVDPTPAIIRFTVMASWWKRAEFVIITSIALMAILVLLFRTINHYRKLKILNSELEKNTIQLRKQNKKIEVQKDRLSKTVEKVNRLSQSRLQFFTNVSHEFRTPLSLIMGPIEELKNTSDKITKSLQEKYYYIIHRNANRLLKLINQILEVYKIEDSTLEFNPKLDDLAAFIKDIANLFETLANQRHIDLKVETLEDSINVCFDHDKIEKIVFNLLSNAFKNVSYGGKIAIRLSLDSIDSTDISETETDKVVKIEVSDNGKGIPEEHLDKIFERFFHVDGDTDKEVHIGTGIGLSYIKDLVRTHQGSVEVMSHPGKITTFTVTIPYITKTSTYLSKSPVEIKDTYPSNIHLAMEDLKRSFELSPLEKTTSEEESSGTKLLIVEDEEDARTFLRHAFEESYTILEARNGLEGLGIVNTEFPDLIISDIMMPEMNGIELCKKIKSDFNTSHIPIVLLTAKTQSEDKILGYDTGADAYVEKPFNVKLLQSRVNTIIKNRQLIKERLQTDIDLRPKELDIAPVDESFIQKVIQAVEEYMDDSSLDAEKLAHEVAVSRIQLYRKIKALTGQTVNEFIKSIRLKYAARLLREDELNISQIAYKTGFAAPNHFSTYFRKHFGVTPTEYAKKPVL